MIWWKRALLVSVGFVIFVIATSVLAVNVYLHGKMTQPQEEAISQVAGMVVGAGVVLIWVVAAQKRNKK